MKCTILQRKYNKTSCSSCDGRSFTIKRHHIKPHFKTSKWMFIDRHNMLITLVVSQTGIRPTDARADQRSAEHAK